MKELAPEFTEVYRSPDPHKDFPYSPGILVLKNGRYVVSLDLNDQYGKIYISDDKGATWTLTNEDSFAHATLFVDPTNDRIYLMGCRVVYGDLVVAFSDDNGETWSKAVEFTHGEKWCHTATNAVYKDGYVYVPMDCKYLNDGETIRSTWQPYIMSPVVMRGRLGDDLSKKENWLMSEKVRFCDVIKEADIEGIGVPFFASLEDSFDGENYCAGPAKYRDTFDFENDKSPYDIFRFHAVGWIETNIVQITDPSHFWYDPSGKTLHLMMRCNTHGTGYCAIMKAVEKVVDGKEIISIECQIAPSGKRLIFLPLLGGQNKFHIRYDEATKLYWLLSVQARDSMRRVELLSPDRYNIPSDERDRLALSFSTNLVDWCFAGLVAQSGHEKQSRHYASLDFDGDDLLVLSRSGDADAHSAHDGNIITFHRVKNYKDLIY